MRYGAGGAINQFALQLISIHALAGLDLVLPPAELE
jgi:hypothetical protein